MADSYIRQDWDRAKALAIQLHCTETEALLLILIEEVRKLRLGGGQ